MCGQSPALLPKRIKPDAQVRMHVAEIPSVRERASRSNHRHIRSKADVVERVHMNAWTAGSSPQDGEFVPKHDEFQFLEIIRLNTHGRKLQNPPNHHVAQREEHEPSRVAGNPRHSTCQPTATLRSSSCGPRPNIGICAPFSRLRRGYATLSGELTAR